MMNKLIIRMILPALLTLCCSGLPGGAVQAADAPRLDVPPVFAGISWGTTAEQVKAQMHTAGFVFTEEDLVHDLGFSGKIDGYRVGIVDYFTPERRLVRTTVAYFAPTDKAKEVYSLLAEEAVKRYGQPTAVSPAVVFERSHDALMGRSALSSNRAESHASDLADATDRVFVQRWKGPVGSGYAVTLGFTPSILFINYDGPAARDEFLRRDSANTENL